MAQVLDGRTVGCPFFDTWRYECCEEIENYSDVVPVDTSSLFFHERSIQLENNIHIVFTSVDTTCPQGPPVRLCLG